MKIGILGGGQLGLMLAEAATELGFATVCLSSSKDCPAARVTDIMVGNFDDVDLLYRLADQVDVMTYEWENVPVSALENLISRTTIFPPLDILRVAQDRLLEKHLFVELHVPTPLFAAIDSIDDLTKQADEIGYPCVLKIRRMGYDGKGQFVLHSKDDIADAWQALQGDAAILEQFVKFDREVSLIAVRDKAKNIAYYPLVENSHHVGILRTTKAPFKDTNLQKQAEKYMCSIMEYADYIGVLTVEFFQIDKQLLANEMAPRVHNSGHWSIEGAQTSQFSNHIRAITGLPLAETTVKGYAAMVNFIGREPDAKQINTIANLYIHSYGKTPRTGRKLGHVTLVAEDPASLEQHLHRLQEFIKDDG